jgi:hypothetical protein
VVRTGRCAEAVVVGQRLLEWVVLACAAAQELDEVEALGVGPAVISLVGVERPAQSARHVPPAPLDWHVRPHRLHELGDRGPGLVPCR